MLSIFSLLSILVAIIHYWNYCLRVIIAVRAVTVRHSLPSINDLWIKLISSCFIYSANYSLVKITEMSDHYQKSLNLKITKKDRKNFLEAINVCLILLRGNLPKNRPWWKMSSSHIPNWRDARLPDVKDCLNGLIALVVHCFLNSNWFAT